MSYLLDTNICIYFLNGQFELNRKIRKEMQRILNIQIENWVDAE